MFWAYFTILSTLGPGPDAHELADAAVASSDGSETRKRKRRDASFD